MTKTNSGTLTILNNNSYTGPTMIGGGVLELETGALLTSGAASAIGAASSNPTNLVFYGSTFRYSGMDTNGTDHGMTIVGGMTVDVTNAAGIFTAVWRHGGVGRVDESRSRDIGDIHRHSTHDGQAVIRAVRVQAGIPECRAIENQVRRTAGRRADGAGALAGEQRAAIKLQNAPANHRRPV